jgi:hypothetical protein
MSSINARNSSQALVRHSSQLATNHKASSKHSRLSVFKGGLGVKVAKDGGLSGKVRPGADGKVSLPGGLTLQAPPAGGLATHLLAPNKLLVLSTDARGLVSLSTKNLGVALDEKKGALKGSALPVEVDGKKMVDLPGLGQVPAPDQGRTSSFLLAQDKLLSLKHEGDGTLTVDTKTLGLEADKKGNFKGHVLPDANGKVDIGGKQLDVSGLKPGQSMKKTLKVGKKKFKVTVRMGEDGSVSVEGKRKKGFLSKVGGFIGKALSFAGRFAPFLAAIPGLGWAAMAGRIFSAVKGVVDGIKSGNWLGAIGSAAGGIAGFAKGALGAIAGKVSQVAHFGQSVLNTVKHGLGKGLLPIIANGANLLSGLGGVLGNKGLAADAGKVSGYAGALDSAGRGDFMPGAAMLANSWGADLVRPKQPKEFSFHPSIRFNTNPTQADFGGPEALAQYDAIIRNGYSVPGGGEGGGGGGAPKGVQDSKGGGKTQGKGLLSQLRGKVSPEQMEKINATIDKVKKAVDYTAAARAPFAETFDALVKQGLPGMQKALAMIPRLQTQRAAVSTSMMAEATKLERMATQFPKGSAQRNALLAEARGIKNLRVQQLKSFDSKLGQLTNLVSKNQKLGQIATHLGRMGKVLDVMGALGAAYEGYQDSSAKTQMGKALDALFEGGANFGVGALASSHPLVAVLSALDGATGNNFGNGPVRNLVRTTMGMMRAYSTGDWSHLEKLVEDNRTGKNGVLIQGATVAGGELDKLIRTLQDRVDSLMNR